jgi:hypothetical protein
MEMAVQERIDAAYEPLRAFPSGAEADCGNMPSDGKCETKIV